MCSQGNLDPTRVYAAFQWESLQLYVVFPWDPGHNRCWICPSRKGWCVMWMHLLQPGMNSPDKWLKLWQNASSWRNYIYISTTKQVCKRRRIILHDVMWLTSTLAICFSWCFFFFFFGSCHVMTHLLYLYFAMNYVFYTYPIIFYIKV